VNGPGTVSLHFVTQCTDVLFVSDSDSQYSKGFRNDSANMIETASRSKFSP